MRKQFKIIEHPADIGIEAYGNSIQEIFKNSAKALIYIIAGNSKIESAHKREIKLTAIDRENLLIRWLNEALYIYDAEKILLSDVKFKTISNNSLNAIVFGEKYNNLKHKLKLDVKAITYHKLLIEEKEGKWKARVFLDI